jgi:hypothetical protein
LDLKKSYIYFWLDFGIRWQSKEKSFSLWKIIGPFEQKSRKIPFGRLSFTDFNTTQPSKAVRSTPKGQIVVGVCVRSKYSTAEQRNDDDDDINM